MLKTYKYRIYPSKGKALGNAIRMAGNDTVVTALGRYRGYCDRLNLSEEFHHNGITLRSSQTCMTDPAISQMHNEERKKETRIELLSKLKIDYLVTHRIPFEVTARAYALTDLHPEELIQVILTY